MDQEPFNTDAILTIGLTENNRISRDRGKDSLRAAYNAARIKVDAMLFKFADGRIRLQSLPPSSMQVGIIFSAAAIATLRPTASLPMTDMMK